MTLYYLYSKIHRTECSYHRNRKSNGERPATHKDRLAKRDIQVRICVQER